MKHKITRRDFVNGVAMAAAGLGLAPIDAIARGLLPAQLAGATYYPPGLTGLRGSHPGSFEIAHRLALSGARFARPQALTDEPYDLVVVGAGLSGLAAAWFYRQQTGPDARILVLDNHDDFGGHATRNEFMVNGTRLISYGGSESISEPDEYSATTMGLLGALGIDIDRFEAYFDSGFEQRHNFNNGLYLSAQSFGARGLFRDALYLGRTTGGSARERAAMIDNYPLSERSRVALKRMVTGAFEFMPEAAKDARVQALSKMKAEAFFATRLGMEEDGIALLRDLPRLELGYGTDVLSARDLAEYGLLDWDRGFALLEQGRGDYYDITGQAKAMNVPDIYHFPDGNASIARMLVRALIPAAAPGSTMEDIVTAPLDYSQLDTDASAVRIRLNATVVDARHVAGERVDVTYARPDGATARVRASRCIMACYNAIIPHLCPELGARQARALAAPEKTPLCYINVALRNWRSIKQAGYSQIYAPRSFLSHLWMDFPVSMGGYHYTSGPDQPVVMQLFHIPTATGEYDDPAEQARAGRRRLLTLSFADFEREINSQLAAIWGAYGFDPARDIAAITVNRWPHGYAHEYLSLWDHPDVAVDGPQAPHVLGRAQIGRISIANSDSEASAYVDGAVRAAWRAVREQVSL